MNESKPHNLSSNIVNESLNDIQSITENNTVNGNKTLGQFSAESKITEIKNEINTTLILADNREQNNRIVKELINLGIPVKTAQLESADYILSDRVGVELKKVPDFVASIIDGRLLDQVRELKKNFGRALLIIEGDEDLYSIRKVHANAIRGMIASIVLDFNVPILYTKSPPDTAGLLAVMAKREQNKETNLNEHINKPYTLSEQQEYLVSSIQGVGLNTAKLLLEHFTSLKNLINASEEEISSIKGIGKKTAEKLVKLFGESYKKG